MVQFLHYLCFYFWVAAFTMLVGIAVPFFGGLLGFFGGLAFAPTTYFVSNYIYLSLTNPPHDPINITINFKVLADITKLRSSFRNLVEV